MAEKEQNYQIADGIHARFVDRGNRYFGDFHRLLINVEISIAVVRDEFAEEFRELLSENDSEIYYRTTLEKMAVSSADYDKDFNLLVTMFMQTTGNYLKQPAFAKALIEKQLRSGRK